MTDGNRYGIGSFIKARRRERKLSQAKLAEMIGMSREYLAQIETGKTRWPQKYIGAIAKALEVPEQRLAIAAGQIEALPTTDAVFDRIYEVGNRIILADVKAKGKRSVFSKIARDFQNAKSDDDRLAQYLMMWTLVVGFRTAVEGTGADEVEKLTRLHFPDESEFAELVRAAL